MKIAIVGVDFPLGKRNLADERLDKLRDIFHSPRITAVQIEFLDSTHLQDADGILCEKNSKLDLVLRDLEVIEKHPDNELCLRCKESLEKEIILNEVPFSQEEKKALSDINLVTLRPIYFVDKENLPSIPQMSRDVYAACGMISFFTVNEKELRAWPIKKGATAFEAAGNIHSDIQRGFIKAEVTSYEDLISSGGLNQAKGRGLVKLEGKEYIVRDGDLIQVRLNV
jgi:ribosome-binding ATPase YchF (GTP1/OBG family)